MPVVLFRGRQLAAAAVAAADLVALVMDPAARWNNCIPYLDSHQKSLLSEKTLVLVLQCRRDCCDAKGMASIESSAARVNLYESKTHGPFLCLAFFVDVD
jgi:hypothetical protein